MTYLSAPGIIKGPNQIDLVDKAAARVWEINPYDLYKRRRDAEIVRPRQAVYYYKNKILKIKQKILQQRTGFDHATINHSCKVIANELKTSKEFRSKYEQFIGEIDKMEGSKAKTFNNEKF